MAESFGTRYTPDELRQRVITAGEVIGEPLYSSEAELERMLTLSEDDLREQYPLKYYAYLESRRGHEFNAQEFATRIWAINNIERFLTTILLNEKAEVSLREHQVEVFRDLLEFFEAGHDRGWIKLPTGAGKTAIFAALIKATGLRAVVLVPRTKLVKQTHEQLARFAEGVTASSFYGKEKDLSGQITVSTYQSSGRLGKELKAQEIMVQLIVCDEAHRALTPITQDNLKGISDKAVVIGLTATPEFSDNKRVPDHFGEQIHEMSIKEGILSDILSGCRCLIVKTDIDISKVPVMTTGEYDPVELEKTLDVAKRNEAALRILQMPQFKDVSTAAFCLSINHSKRLAALAQAQGIKAAHIDGTMNEEERDAIYEAFEKGEITLICSVDLLTEGWDAPRAELGLMLRPTRSRVVAEQRGGRILRRYELGNGQMKVAKVFDFIDRHHLEDEPPISMVDVLGGAVVLPPHIESQWEGEGGGGDLNFFDIDGISVVSDIQEILELTKRDTEKEEKFNLTTKEEFEQALLNVTSPTLDQIQTMSGSVFLSELIVSPFFQGRGRALIQMYNRNVRNTPEARILAADVSIFLAEVLGEKFNKERRGATIRNMTDRDMGTFLKDNLARPLPELLEQSVTAGPKTAKISVTGAEIFEARNLPVTEESLAILAQDAFRHRKAEQAAALMEERRKLLTLNEMAESGALAEFCRSIPNLVYMTPADLLKAHPLVAVPHQQGFTLPMVRILEHYEVDKASTESYQQWVNELMEDENYVKNALRELSQHMKEELQNREVTRFFTLAEFLRLPFRVPDGSMTLTGRQYYALRQREPSHTNFAKLMGHFMDRKDFCLEFWPLNRRLMLTIVIDTLKQNHHGTSMPADPRQFMGMRLSYEHLRQTGDLVTGFDLLTYWEGSRYFDDTHVSPGRTGIKLKTYHDFVAFLKGETSS